MTRKDLAGKRRTARAWWAATGTIAIAIVAILMIGTSSAWSARGGSMPGKQNWQHLGTKLAAAHGNAQRKILTTKAQGYSLDRAGLASLLRAAPAPTTARGAGVVLSLPDPNGKFQRFVVHRSQVMSPGLAAKHPEIQTYSGVGIDDSAATIHADLSPLGFHASVRSAGGAWYIDPYYHLDQSVYASYYGRNVTEAATFVERDADAAELSVDRGYYHADESVTVHGSGFDENKAVTVTISDPEEKFATRTVNETSDDSGSFDASFTADPDGNLETHIVEASDGTSSASSSYQVVRADDPTVDPPTGDVLRTYRLALITDPGYSDFVGGPANVTAAKVALMNRVDQVYEDDISIHMQLIANNDALNLNTWGAATAPNGPCGLAACFTQAQVTGCSSTTRARFVIGQIIGASNYDIGHLALGQPGGGVANLGVVGRSNKAGGCTGIPTPIGDFYAIDYVAHEMGHQFSGNHPFNGNQLNCSGGNRNPATSVEPGSGSSIMAYAGICLTDDLQRHSDPYFSERSQQEISTYTSSNQNAINEVQTASLRHFGGGSEQQVVTFGPGYQQASTIQPLTVAIGAVPSAAQLAGLDETGNTVTVSTGAAGATHTLQPGDVVTIAGAANAGYNGTFTVNSVLTSRAFTVTNPTSGLPRSGGGTITLNAPGLSESGTTVTARTSAANGRSVGDIVVVTGAPIGAYNGTVTVTAVPTARSFQYTVAPPAATNITTATNASGTIATFASTGHGLFVGQQVTIAGVSVAAYNGTWTVASTPNANTFTVDIGTSGNANGTGGTVTGNNLGLPNSGGGTVTYSSPFQARIGGQNSAVIGGSAQAYNTTNIQNAINAIPGFAGTVTVSGVASTGFTVTYGAASANTDVPNFQLVNLS